MSKPNLEEIKKKILQMRELAEYHEAKRKNCLDPLERQLHGEYALDYREEEVTLEAKLVEIGILPFHY